MHQTSAAGASRSTSTSLDGDPAVAGPTVKENLPTFATIPNALRIAGIGRSKLYQLIGDGHIAARKLGRKALIDQRSLCAYLENLPLAQIGRSRPLGAVTDASGASGSAHKSRLGKRAKSAAA